MSRRSAGRAFGGFGGFLSAKASGGAVWLLMAAIRVYQLTLSPALTVVFGVTGGCRYTPTCSAYAMEALREHGALSGTVLAARRLCRCHPWGGCGHDPVPRKGSDSAGRIPKFI